MNENFKVYFKVTNENGKTITTGSFDKEYANKASAKRFMNNMSTVVNNCEMTVAQSNPFVE